MEIYNVILYCTLFHSILALTLPYDITEFKNESTLSSDIQTSGCDKDKCKNKNCNCCPGYGIKKSRMLLFEPHSCEKCDCGDNYNCTFSGNKNTQKTCICPSGYFDNNGQCKVPCDVTNPCKNGGTCVKGTEKSFCKCKYGTSGHFCEIVDDCYYKPALCGDEYKSGAKCIFDQINEKAACECPDTHLSFDERSLMCRVKCWEQNDCRGNRICSKDKFCECKTGYEGEDCEIITGCKEMTKQCDKISNACIFDELSPDKATCKCDGEYQYDRTANECRIKCWEQNDCRGNRICNKDKFCECKTGYEGEDCEIITGCKEMKKHCDKISKACIFDELSLDKATCQCDGEHKYDRNANECRIKCLDQNDCTGNRICNNDNFCECKTGYEGEDCEIITGCKEIKKHCDKISKACIFDELSPDKATCQCDGEYRYDRKANECRIPDDKCRINLPACKETGGSCIVDLNNIIVCNCPVDTSYDRNIGCKATENMCQDLMPKCIVSGGSCISDQNKSIFCKCPAHTVYEANIGCKASDIHCKSFMPRCLETGGYCISAKTKEIFCKCRALTAYYRNIGCKLGAENQCKAIKPNCLETGGTCMSDKERNIVCSCPANKMYVKDIGCKEVCENSTCLNGGICFRDGGKRFCKCKTGTSGDFCEIVDECQNNRTLCGNKYSFDATCVYDQEVEKATCVCTDNALSFDEHTLMCRVLCDEKNTCKNGGVCDEINAKSFCKCKVGTSGHLCDIVDECHKNLTRCGNDYLSGAICVYDQKIEKTTCVCEDNTLRFDERTLMCRDLCEGVICFNGQCKPEDGKCKCDSDFSGEQCEIFSKEKCKEKMETCANTEGTCKSVDTKDIVQCECPGDTIFTETEGCKAPDANVCNGVTCFNGGLCKDDSGKAACECINDFTGDKCEIFPKDKCQTKIEKCVETNGTCKSVDKKNVKCTCRPSFTFVKDHGCQDLTSTEDSGIHVSVYFNSKNSSINGTKFDFHFGRKEESNRTRTQLILRLESESVISTFDRKCSKISCKNGGICVIENEKAVCNCTDKYTGDYCEKDKCSLINCQNDGSCKIKNGKTECICTEGYFGDYCEKKCNCENGICKEISGKPECVCYPEYGMYKKEVCKACECGKGANCTFMEGKFWNLKRKICICPEDFVEVDGVCVDPDLYNPCLNNSCKNGAHCEKNGIRAKCICQPEYDGELCQYDKCSLIKCQNGGKCDINHGKAFCECDDKHVGQFCEIEKCSLMKCLNGGKCEIINRKTVCVCNDQFTGDFCEKDKCSLIQCQNGGKCYIKNGHALCNCPDNFTGDHCERRNSMIRK